MLAESLENLLNAVTKQRKGVRGEGLWRTWRRGRGG